MQIIYNIFNVILDAGAVVMLPIIITIVGLIFQVKLSKAFRFDNRNWFCRHQSGYQYAKKQSGSCCSGNGRKFRH